MGFFKFVLVLTISCFFTLNGASQRTIEPEWIDQDVKIFQQFFENFPLNSETTIDSLRHIIPNFNQSEIDTIGFDGYLHRCGLIGGYLRIITNIATYKNSVVMVEASIYKDDLKSLNLVFQRDHNIEVQFKKLFALKKNPYAPTDSTYQYTYINPVSFQAYKNHVATYLGEQSVVDTKKCVFEYDLLNNPLCAMAPAQSNKKQDRRYCIRTISC